MRVQSNGRWSLGFVAMLGLPVLLLGQASGLREGLSDIATREGSRSLEGKKLPIEQPRFQGIFEAVEPRSRFKAKVNAFSFSNDRAEVKITITGIGQLKGKLKTDNGGVDVTARLEMAIDVQATVTLLARGDAFFWKPTINDLDVRLGQIDVTPAELGIHSKNLAEALNGAFRNDKEKLKNYLNSTLKETEIK